MHRGGLLLLVLAVAFGMAMDPKSRRIFSGCDNKMMAVMDADTGKVLATPAIGAGVDATDVYGG
jgi:hypothetical protein